MAYKTFRKVAGYKVGWGPAGTWLSVKADPWLCYIILLRSLVNYIAIILCFKSTTHIAYFTA